jgi:hypothetical protein
VEALSHPTDYRTTHNPASNAAECKNRDDIHDRVTFYFKMELGRRATGKHIDEESSKETVAKNANDLMRRSDK